MKRILESRLRAKALKHAAVVLVGPAGAGKLSCTAKFAASVDVLDTRHGMSDAADVRQGQDFVANAQLDPSLLLRGNDPHLIADIDCVPGAWGEAVRYARALSEAQSTGVLFITSNSLFAEYAEFGMEGEDSTFVHMLPLSLQEMGLSTGHVSLAGLFEGQMSASTFGNTDTQLAGAGMQLAGAGTQLAGAGTQLAPTSTDLARIICKSGWPDICQLDAHQAQAQADEHMQFLIKRAAQARHLKMKMAQACAWAIARNIGDNPSFENYLIGLEATLGKRPSRDTLRTYVQELTACQLLLPIPGWTPPGRERRRARMKTMYYFVDPSMAVALMSLNPYDIAEQPQLLHRLLKNLIARDLSTYMEALGGQRVKYYRDEKGFAADFVLEHVRPGGEVAWGAVRVAVSEAGVNEAAHDLRVIARKLRDNPPAFLAVICGKTAASYQRDDGVFVVSLWELGV